MSSHNEPVQPAQFKAAQPAPAAAEPAAADSTATASHRWVLPSLALLLLLAVLVIFWLPGQVTPPPPDSADSAVRSEPASPAQADSRPAAPADVEPAAPEAASPWSDAREARLRRETQDILAALLDLQFELEERGAPRWAPAEFAEAAAEAEAGDAAYREQDYTAATARYQAGLDSLQALQERMPDEFRRLLQEATTAVEDGDAETAAATLEVAALIEPGDAALAGLQARVDTLPALLDLLVTASEQEAAGDLVAAMGTLQDATTLDPLHQRAARERSRVVALEQQARFQRAMSRGYLALDEGRYQEARSLFNEAAALQPGSAEAASALLEVDTARASGRLASLKRQGLGHEQAERWQAAVDAYESALAIDGNVLFAREGLERGRDRARLDASLRAILDEPARLSNPRVAAEADALLREAGLAESPRATLDTQVTELARLLDRANTPVAVTLRSDSETEVIVQRVARLGRFEQRELSLRPGDYTAVGSRNGFRDVRRTFTVNIDGTTDPVTVICTERI